MSLRITIHYSAPAAKKYFDLHLRWQDRLAKDRQQERERPGRWLGEGAARLGLAGKVARTDYHRLCDNLDPQTGKRLTARTKEHRRVCIDFCWSPPKSVSIMHAMTKDERIPKALQEAVNETMREVERAAQTRVRKGGVQDQDRVTGNIVCAVFTHHTARPVGGVSDPFLHEHSLIFNSTFDQTEQQHKALQLGEVVKNKLLFQEVFHARLAGKLMDLGYEVERRGKSWELAAISRATIEKFSQRTEVINRKIEVGGITDPKRKGNLAVETREPKKADLSLSDLSRRWDARLTSDERGRIVSARAAAQGQRLASQPLVMPKEAYQRAEAVVFERSAVARRETLLARVIDAGLGSVSIEQAKAAIVIHGQELIHRQTGRDQYVAHPKVLAREKEMAIFVREGRGTNQPLRPGYEVRDRSLADNYRQAVRYIAESPDQVIAIRGAAGQGQAAMMKEVRTAIEAGGRQMIVLTPKAENSRGDQHSDSFANVTTLTRFLQDRSSHELTAGQVIWVSEASQMTVTAMKQLCEITEAWDCRVILSGETRQRGTTGRGDILHLFETEAGLKTIDLGKADRSRIQLTAQQSKICRQSG